MSHINKILVPVDGSPPSLAALAEAVELAVDLGATLDVLAVDWPAAGADPTRMSPSEPNRKMEEALAAAKDRLGEALSHTREAGEPVRTILATAARQSASLIVMGT